MSWLDSITPNFMLSEEKRIQKEQRRVTNRDLQAEDREGAARWLADHKNPKALVALLTRFDMKLDHQMNDRDEREFVYGLLASRGDAVNRPLRAHLKRCKMIAMPIRLFAELNGPRDAVEMAFELLKAELDRDDFKPEKKTDLLVWLVDHKHERAIENVTPFLSDFDEGVRYAAAEVMLAQNDDSARPILEKEILANPQEESNRLKVRLCEAFQKRGWTLDDPDAVEPNLHETFKIVEGRLVAK